MNIKISFHFQTAVNIIWYQNLPLEFNLRIFFFVEIFIFECFILWSEFHATVTLIFGDLINFVNEGFDQKYRNRRIAIAISTIFWELHIDNHKFDLDVPKKCILKIIFETIGRIIFGKAISRKTIKEIRSPSNDQLHHSSRKMI